MYVFLQNFTTRERTMEAMTSREKLVGLQHLSAAKQ